MGTPDTAALGDLTITRVGFGAMQLPGPGVLGPPRDHDEAIAVLRRVVEAGVTHIDTAQFYGPAVANELIREALHPYAEDLVLVSKVGARRDDEGAWLPAQTPAELRSAVEDNLRTLGAERLGAVNLRLMDPEHLGDAPAEQREVSLDDQLAEMAAMRDEGLIAGVGLSTATLEQVRHAQESVGLVCVQNAYSLLDRSDDEVLDYCSAHAIAYVPYFPLGSAFPGMPKVVEDPRVQRVAERHGVTPAQVGLCWLLNRDPHVCLIPGTSRLAHLEENLALSDVTLDSSDLGLLVSDVEARG